MGTGRIMGIKTTLLENPWRESPAGSEVVVGPEKEIIRWYVKWLLRKLLWPKLWLEQRIQKGHCVCQIQEKNVDLVSDLRAWLKKKKIQNYYSIFHLLNSDWEFLYSVVKVVPSPRLSKVQSKRLDSWDCDCVSEPPQETSPGKKEGMRPIKGGDMSWSDSRSPL